MDLSYEETMRRIEEYEKNDIMEYKYCREKKFPYHINIFNGESQMIVVPLITAIGWYSTEMAWYRQITDVLDAEKIGKTVFEALERIRIGHVDARTRKEREDDCFRWQITKYKSYKTFNKNYLYCAVIFYEDGTFLICPGGHSEVNYVYDEREKETSLPSTATQIEIGEAVIKNFADMEAFYATHKSVKPIVPPTTIELLSEGLSVTIQPPKDKHFIDAEDYGAGEIYQGYSYLPREDADESSAEFYLGIAAELNCNLSEENIRSVWGRCDGKADFFEVKEANHPLFTLRAEMRNKNVHRVSYLKEIDADELLECSMTIKNPNKRKKLDEKLSQQFEDFAFSCKWKA